MLLCSFVGSLPVMSFFLGLCFLVALLSAAYLIIRFGAVSGTCFEEVFSLSAAMLCHIAVLLVCVWLCPVAMLLWLAAICSIVGWWVLYGVSTAAWQVPDLARVWFISGPTKDKKFPGRGLSVVSSSLCSAVPPLQVTCGVTAAAVLLLFCQDAGTAVAEFSIPYGQFISGWIAAAAIACTFWRLKFVSEICFCSVVPGPLGDLFGSAVVLVMPELLALLGFSATGVMERVVPLGWPVERRRVLGLRVLTWGPRFAWRAQAQATPRVDVDEVPSSGSLGVQFVGDMPIFLDGLPGGVRVLHSTPDCTVAQFCVQGCYFMLGHRIWSQGAACDIGMRRDSRVTVHSRLVGGSSFQCWTCPNCKVDKCWPARMSCFMCGCPKPRAGTGRQGGHQGGRELNYAGKPGNVNEGISSYPTFRELGEGPQAGRADWAEAVDEAIRPCHVRATRILCLRFKHKRWRFSRICLGLMSLLSCVKNCRRKRSLLKRWRTGLQRKKRELDKKIAYSANLKLQHDQMMAKLAQHVARSSGCHLKSHSSKFPSSNMSMMSYGRNISRDHHRCSAWR